MLPIPTCTLLFYPVFSCKELWQGSCSLSTMPATVYTALLCALAAPAWGAVWESLPAGVPSAWSHVSTPAGDAPISLSISLSRKNLDQLESTLRKVSTPGQAQYGKWLDEDDIESQFPIVDDAAVVNWLKDAGISDYARDGSLLSFTGSVEKVNKLLDTNFAHYQSGDAVKLRTTQYSIPDDLADYIDLISPTVYFGKTRAAVPKASKAKETRKVSKTEVAASCQTSITPSCLKEMYNIGNYTPKVEAGSRIGFGSFLNQSASQSDLKQYEELFGIASQNFTVETLNGGVDNQTASVADVGEANLDVQLIVAVSHPLPVHEFIAAGVAYVYRVSEEMRHIADH